MRKLVTVNLFPKVSFLLTENKIKEEMNETGKGA